MERKRTFEWQDPSIAKARLLELSGLEYLQAIYAGEIPPPPLMQTLDFTAGKIGEGIALFSFLPQEFHYNTLESVHGGVLSALLDSAMGCALHSELTQGTGYTTIELKINFLKPVTIESGPMKAVAQVLHLGKRTGLVEGRLLDQQETLYAFGTCTCLLLK